MTFPQQFIDERERVSGHVNRKALLFPMIVFNRANNKFDSAHTINKWPAIQYDEKKEIIDISPGNNPTSIDREVMLASIESMLSFNPKSIHGAAEYIASLAYECLKLGIKIPSLRVVDLGHNYPWYPYKKIIEEAFGVPVYTRYHSSENGTIAAMCHKQKTHILERNKYVELITHGKSTRPGEMGAVVITSMDNIYRPFIRYNQGDVAVILPNTCDCGLVSPLIELRGRIHDLTQGSIKPWVTNLEINQLLMHIPHFYHFQITIHADKIDWNIRMENGRDLVKVKDLENKASDLFLRPVKISWMESLNVKGLGKLLGVVNTENKQPKYDYFFKS